MFWFVIAVVAIIAMLIFMKWRRYNIENLWEHFETMEEMREHYREEYGWDFPGPELEKELAQSGMSDRLQDLCRKRAEVNETKLKLASRNHGAVSWLTGLPTKTHTG